MYCIIRSHVYGPAPLAREPFFRNLPVPTSVAGRAEFLPEVLSSAPPAPVTFFRSLAIRLSAAGKFESVSRCP